MSEYASPVSSPPFKYTSSTGFYVDTPVYEGRHPRCGSNRLYEILTCEDTGPAYTKEGKLKVHQPPRHKDRSQHFYTAQCVHYGLTPLRSRQAAKKALMAAYKGSENGLNVPEDILQIERRLTDMFEVKNEAAEKKLHEERKVQSEAEDKQRKKRKRDEEELRAEVRGNAETDDVAKRSKPNAPLRLLDAASLQGIYNIAAPKVSDGWDCDGPLTLTLASSVAGSHLWGSFDFGVFEGTLRSCSSLEPIDNNIHFLWRGRETGEGETTYGDENVAEFKFLGDGKFSGSMYWDCLGTFDLVGKSDRAASHNLDFSGNVEIWKDEYWSINDSNYEAARVGRWGGGGGWGYGGGESEEESNSDTDNEHRAFDTDEDEESEQEESSDASE